MQMQNIVIVKMDCIIADIKAECMTDLCTYNLYFKFKNMDIVPKLYLLAGRKEILACKDYVHSKLNFEMLRVKVVTGIQFKSKIKPNEFIG